MTAAQRKHAVAILDYFHAHASQLDYPPNDHRNERDSYFWGLTEQGIEHVLGSGGRLMFDCSELYAKVLQLCGCWPLRYPGYTGTDLQVCQPHYTNPKVCLPGAGVVFGPGTGDHICMVHTADRKNGNPLVAGHGRQGFDVERLSVVRARHRTPVTLISVAHL